MANAARLVRGESQKEIAKLFDSVAGKYPRYTVWQDFMFMAATSISNAVDLVHQEEREKMYLQVAGKYTTAELKVFAQIFVEVVNGMERNPDQDFLGDMYMSLELGNSHVGQFFTPYSVCRAMAAMVEPNVAGRIEREHFASVCDPACGAGALLVAFANECLKQKVNYQPNVLFVAQDLDMTVACMCYIHLSLLGCAGYVVVGDTLASPSTSYDKRGLLPMDNGNVWYTPMYFSPIWHGRQICARMDLFAHRNAAESQHIKPEHFENAAPTVSKTTQHFEADAAGQLSFF